MGSAQCDALIATIWDRVKRVRTVVKSVFGIRLDGNASEDEVVGARLGECKSGMRKKEEGIAEEHKF